MLEVIDLQASKESILTHCDGSRDYDIRRAKYNGIEEFKTTHNNKTKWLSFQEDLKWVTAVILFLAHVVAVYGLLTFPYITHYRTFIWSLITLFSAIFSITSGVHRFWSHRSYEATLPLRIFLAMVYLSAGQLRIKKFVLIHRQHHKYTDTDADPHNSNRGFFYSHLGWLMLKRSKEVQDKWKTIDVSDIDADPIVRFCDRYFRLLSVTLTAIIPIVVPVYFWNESWYYAYLAMVMRFICLLNLTASVNSFAHMFGLKPYNKNSKATNLHVVAGLTLGEGWHNFHHAFPYDYRSSEFGGWEFDVTGIILRFYGKIGLAYNFKTAPDSLIKLSADRKGDGTRLLRPTIN